MEFRFFVFALEEVSLRQNLTELQDRVVVLGCHHLLHEVNYTLYTFYYRLAIYVDEVHPLRTDVPSLFRYACAQYALFFPVPHVFMLLIVQFTQKL